MSHFHDIYPFGVVTAAHGRTSVAFFVEFPSPFPTNPTSYFNPKPFPLMSEEVGSLSYHFLPPAYIRFIFPLTVHYQPTTKRR